jgi:hypothetical protein
MWMFAGITLTLIILPMLEGWRLRRDDKKRLENMRRSFSAGQHWDALKGRWSDDHDAH